jgi:hypothetical protein
LKTDLFCKGGLGISAGNIFHLVFNGYLTYGRWWFGTKLSVRLCILHSAADLVADFL